MLYEELLQKAKATAKRNHWRLGQALFNDLFALHPLIANEIRATPLDPFYSDEISLETERHLRVALYKLVEQSDGTGQEERKHGSPTTGHVDHVPEGDVQG